MWQQKAESKKKSANGGRVCVKKINKIEAISQSFLAGEFEKCVYTNIKLEYNDHKTNHLYEAE